MPNSTTTRPSAGNALEAMDLECVRGGNPLFHALDFKLESGSVLQILGRNGCGKTSLLRILCGLSLPENGTVCWNGRDIRRNRYQYHSRLAYLGHQPSIKEELSAVENLQFSCSINAQRVNLSIHEMLQRVGLGECLHLPCRSLSAGQRQRVALARVMLHPGELWILDEPATSLDQDAVSMLAGVVDEHVSGGGMVAFTSHQPLALQHGVVKTLQLDQYQ